MKKFNILASDMNIEGREIEPRQPFSLQEFLTFHNSKLDEYLQLINNERPEMSGCSAQVAHLWEEIVEDGQRPVDPRWPEEREGERTAVNFFHESLAPDVPLIDLGAGQPSKNIHLPMLAFARRFGIQTYVGVDRFIDSRQGSDPFHRIEENLYPDWDGHGTEPVYVQADMLEFMSYVPDESVNIVINNIDDIIIKDRQGNYNKALAHEIQRAARTGGAIFGMDSSVFHYLSGLDNLKHVPGGKKFTRLFTKK